MFTPTEVIGVTILLIGALFLIAWWVERSPLLTEKVGNSGITYVLCLAVYHTAWTFYGSVGKAATNGMLFLPIYLGSTLAFLFWWTFVRKLVRIKNGFHITSVADFISARYGGSSVIAALATALAVVGMTPYIALQLMGILSSFAAITEGAAPGFLQANMNLIVVALVTVFTIGVGIKRLDPTERHPGLMTALAVSCVIKIAAFLAVGLFVTYGMYGGLGDILQKVAQSPTPLATGGAPFMSWMTFTALSMSAIIFLPRDFHVTVIENANERFIGPSMWLFPLYMLLINIFVYPIAMAGLLQGLPAGKADTFVLSLPLNAGAHALGMFAFVGGLCAAVGMIIIESLAVSIMVSNHLLLPVIEAAAPLHALRRHLLKCRWAVVVGYLALGYAFASALGSSYMLVNIGMISFAAVLQFAPASIGGLYWREGNRAGATWGLAGGFAAWFYTLLLPAMIKSGWFPMSWLSDGPLGIALLRPDHLFGVTQLDGLTHGVFWSMALNIGLYVLGSVVCEQGKEERLVADEFVDCLNPKPAPAASEEKLPIDLPAKNKLLVELLGNYIDRQEAQFIIDECLIGMGIYEKTQISIVELGDLNRKVEVILGGLIGAANARSAVLRNRIFTAEENRRLIEARAA